MRLALIALLSLSGCGTLHCLTKCGVRVEVAPGLEERWTCDVIQELEDRSFDSFNRHVKDPRFVAACPLIRGYTMYIIEAPNWIDDIGRDVVGLTDCAGLKITIGNDEPLRSSYTHETAHAVQRCLGLGPYDGLKMDGHENWERDGVYKAVWESEDITCEYPPCREP